MTCDFEDSAVERLLPLLTSGNDDRFREALALLLNAAMVLERQQHLRAEPFERTEARNGQANGFKNKTFQSRLGTLPLRVPQVRGSDEPFYPQSLEKGSRSERALKVALAEMYVQGVSTRKVAHITEQLCGFEVSTAQVSRAAAQLDETLEAWRCQPLGEMPYLILDARYEKVRQAQAGLHAQALSKALLSWSPWASAWMANGRLSECQWRCRSRKRTGAPSSRAW